MRNGWKVEDGIRYYCDIESEPTAFSAEKAALLFKLEDYSWWFQYRALILGEIIKRYFSSDKVIFDIGGGNGYTTMRLQNKGYKMVLLEPSWEECRNAVKRGVLEVICGNLNEYDFSDREIPQMMLLDVLEHIELDDMMLDLMKVKLSDDGRLLLTVPAFSFLWSSQDDMAGHFRRYDRKTLNKMLITHGFKIEYSTCFFSFLLLPLLVMRVGFERVGILKRAEERNAMEKEKIAKQQFEHPNRIIDLILTGFEKMELFFLLHGWSLPWGTSILVVASKQKKRNEI